MAVVAAAAADTNSRSVVMTSGIDSGWVADLQIAEVEPGIGSGVVLGTAEKPVQMER